MITIGCQCGKSLKAPKEMAGKRGRCPYCKAVTTIPAEPPVEQFSGWRQKRLVNGEYVRVSPSQADSRTA